MSLFYTVSGRCAAFKCRGASPGSSDGSTGSGGNTGAVLGCKPESI